MNYEKEIGNLNKDATRLLEKYEEKIKEIERLNNIINELEKIVRLKYEEYDNEVKKSKSIANEMCRNAYWYVIYNIQKLKDSDKE